MTGVVVAALVGLAALPWAVGGSRVVRSRAGRPGEGPVGAVRRRRWRHRRASRPPEVDEAVVLDLVRAALAAGVSLLDAIDAVGNALGPPQGHRYTTAARALRLGVPWEQAWSPGDGEVMHALAAAWADGVDPSPLLLHAAATIRRQRTWRAKEAAARLGVRVVLPLGLCLLPAFVMLGLVPILISAGLQLWTG